MLINHCFAPPLLAVSQPIRVEQTFAHGVALRACIGKGVFTSKLSKGIFTDKENSPWALKYYYDLRD